MYNNNVNMIETLWNGDKKSMRCPRCRGPLTMVQEEPLEDSDELYTTYSTIIECTKCSFQTTAESFTIFGSVKEYDSQQVEIGSWSPSGSRVVSKYDHHLNPDLLKELKTSEELVEFLILNHHVIQVIG